MNKLPADISFALDKFGLAMSLVPLSDNMLKFYARMTDKIVRRVEFDVYYIAHPDARTGFKGGVIEFTSFHENDEYKLVVHDRPSIPEEE